MRSYRNLVLDLLQVFTKYSISWIPTWQNVTVDALTTLASESKIPIYPNRKYEIEVKHRPYIPDNVKYQQVFEDNQQIKRFLDMSEEFVNTHVDDENLLEMMDKNLEEILVSIPKLQEYINVVVGKEIIQLKNNFIPKRFSST